MKININKKKNILYFEQIINKKGNIQSFSNYIDLLSTGFLNVETNQSISFKEYRESKGQFQHTRIPDLIYKRLFVNTQMNGVILIYDYDNKYQHVDDLGKFPYIELTEENFKNNFKSI